MHIEKYKTHVSMTKSYNHNYRQLTSRTVREDGVDNFANIDFNRIALNKELIDTYSRKDYALTFDEKFANMEYYKTNTLRKDAVRGLEVMLTMSPEMAEKINVNDWAKANVEWLQNTFGVDNVESAMLHLDESTPHIHGFVLPIVAGRFCADKILGDRTKLIKLQNSYAKAMEPFGLDRGIAGTHAKHKKVSKMHGELNASIEKIDKIAAVQKNSLGKTESAQAYSERIMPILEELISRNNELERENVRLKKIQKVIIDKDKFYSNIKENLQSIEIDDETLKKAILGQCVYKIMTEHPDKRVRESFEKYVDLAIKWNEKQNELEKKLDR